MDLENGKITSNMKSDFAMLVERQDQKHHWTFLEKHIG